MRFQSVLTVCLLILLIANTTAFDLGKVLKDTTQKVKESAQKVAQESKKAVEKTEDLAEKIKDKVGEKVKRECNFLLHFSKCYLIVSLWYSIK